MAAAAAYPAAPSPLPASRAWPEGLYLLVPAEPCGDDAGFASGGATDALPPGPALAGLAGDIWDRGLERLSDDELVGVLRAGRRLASWAAAMELAAAGDLWRRRMDEEEAGDTGAGEHTGDEIAAALTLTGRSADRLLDLAISLRRLPATSTALAAGDIDVPRAMVIAEELTGLADEHAAAIERMVVGTAPRQTTGQLRRATHRAVLATDPAAARQRRIEAEREARVERWTEPAGTAALAGRDLPPGAVLAADANLTAQARQLKAAGTEGTMDSLRAKIYLALLTGVPVTCLLPGNPGATSTDGGGTPDGAPSGSAVSAAATASPGDLIWLVGTGLTGRVNLTLPLTTWLGGSHTPGYVAGYGPLDAADSRAVVGALAARADSKWCLTLTDARGTPVAHGCARLRAPAGRRRAPPAGASPTTWTAVAPPTTWTFTISFLEREQCRHARQTAAYQPSPALRHLIEIRQATCAFPGCMRPAVRCDKDHTVPYHLGGRTCECNLAPLCRHHHEVKQARSWALEQNRPGVMTWTTPAGRRYTVTPTRYPG